MQTPPILENPIGRIGELLDLAGLPGSGKSTVAKELELQVNHTFGEGTMVALGMDGFHLTKQNLSQMPDPELAFARRGAPWTFDSVSLAERLKLLRTAAGRKQVSWPGFEHGVGDPVADQYVVEPDVKLVLVEGLYLIYKYDGWENVYNQFDERWFLDTSYEISRERLALRHMSSRKITRTEAERRIDLNDNLNAATTFSTRQYCDWRVKSTA
jgi:pantothenate kinase